MVGRARTLHSRRAGTPVLVALLAAIALVLAALPVTADDALPRWRGGLDLYRPGVFTTQKTWSWCTAADVQIMRNIVHAQDEPHQGTAAPVLRLHAGARPIPHPAA